MKLGHDHTPTPSGSGRRGAVRESGAAVVREADEGAGRSASGAVSARTRRGRLRAGDAGTARRGGTAVEVFDSETGGAGWTAEFEEWSQRRLEGRVVVYVWADGIYVKAGLERDKAALLVVLGAMRDGTKEVLARWASSHVIAPRPRPVMPR